MWYATFSLGYSQKKIREADLRSCTLGYSQEISTVYRKCSLSRHILSSPARGGRIFSCFYSFLRDCSALFWRSSTADLAGLPAQLFRVCIHSVLDFAIWFMLRMIVPPQLLGIGATSFAVLQIRVHVPYKVMLPVPGTVKKDTLPRGFRYLAQVNTPTDGGSC